MSRRSVIPEDARQRLRLTEESPNGHADAAPIGRLLSDVKAEEVRWLWSGRIPLGKLTLIDGDPGTGKSAMTTDLAARVSVGRAYPDGGECEAGGVVILSAEDGLADTIRPRLDAAGGDASKVLALATVPDEGAEGSERLISIPEDLALIRRGIERVDARLVIVDPLMAFLSGDVDSHRDQDVRRALAPLAKLAEETGAAVVVVRHLNKATGGSSLYRGGGSIGIIGAARSALLVAKHPEDDSRRVLAPLKGNLAAPAPALEFALAEAANGAVRVEWRGESILSAETLLSAPTDPEERSALEAAQEFLREVLADGPLPAKDTEAEGRDAGHEPRTLKRAKQKLGIVSERQGGIGEKGRWTWKLPNTKEPKPETGPLRGGSDSTEGENPAYTGQKPDAALRGPSAGDVKESSGQGPLSETFSAAPVHAPPAELAPLLDSRPGWLTRQARKCLEGGAPDRLVKPLANTVADQYLGNVRRGGEALPFVREHLETLGQVKGVQDA